MSKVTYEEVWKDIPGYENIYQVSDLGNVRSLINNGTVLKKFDRDKKGYNSVCLYDSKGKQVFHRVGRLVGITFLGIHGGRETINHINEVRNDDRLVNIEWMSMRENIRYSKTKSVIGRRLTDNKTKYYEAVRDTKKDGFDPGSVSKVCKGTKPQHKGWVFGYVEEYIESQKENEDD